MDRSTPGIRIRWNEQAVSPVVGTILMVAVTVALGATVLAVMSGVGDDEIKESTNAVFKATPVDTDGNGKTDTIKVTYISGPGNVALGDVTVTVRSGSSAATVPSPPVTGTQTTATWDPGDFVIVNPSSNGAWFVTVSALGNTVLDQTLQLDE